MYLSWGPRKTRLSALISSRGDEDEDGTAVDRLMHGQNAIGKTSKTSEIDALRFQDKDLQVVGTLEYGQFGVIELATCRLDNRVYVRKSIEKKFAMRTREQCSPQTERNILLAATLSDSPWAPHLLAAYQMPTHLHLVMDYAEGGNLWDVLESSPHDGKLPESDLKWWAPQVVSAIHWCHSQGFAHRDIKPHNFVLTKDARIQLIDFGSAAPLLPPGPDGAQKLPRKHCLVPCGTCDYISPEILQAHEEALVALEMEDEDDTNLLARESKQDPEGYGVETDWWSLGAMLYELAYGIAPFFANEIRHTYQRILNHEKSLRFDSGISPQLQDLLQRLLTHPERRLGRRNIMEITDHPFFDGTAWSTLSSAHPPSNLHLPQFTYSVPEPQLADPSTNAPSPMNVDPKEESYSQGFAFSALFQSSNASVAPSISFLRNSVTPRPLKSSPRDDPSSAFIGFSWGPAIDAFPDQVQSDLDPNHVNIAGTPSPFRAISPLLTPGYTGSNTLSTPLPANRYATPQFITPVRPYALSHSPMNTIRRTSTLRRTAGKREVSDREAMKQLVDCIGMSARKKVLESGRKPKILTSYNLGGRRRSGSTNSLSLRSSLNRGKSLSGDTADIGPTTISNTAVNSHGTNMGTLRKELRFYPTVTPIPMPDYNSVKNEFTDDEDYTSQTQPTRTSRLAPLMLGHTNSKGAKALTEDPDTSDIDGTSGGGYINYHYYSSSECTDSEGPPSPSPSPRPSSVMSISRRSGTPTITATMSTFSARMRSASGSNFSGTALLGIPSPSLPPGQWGKPWEQERDLTNTVKKTEERQKATSIVQETLDNSEKVAVLEKPVLSNSRSRRTASLDASDLLQNRRKAPRKSLEVVAGPVQENRSEAPPPRPTFRSTASLWEELEERHERMMYDIKKLEQRLELVSQSIDGGGYGL